MRNWVKIRRWVWEFPQTLVGAIICLVHKDKPLRIIEYADQKVYLYDKFHGGISLGYYSHIDWNAKDHNNNNIREGIKRTVKHEAGGHGKQSKWLGWFYLPIIGLPSIIHCWIHIMCKRRWNYYSFPTEKWADKLGGVER